MSKVRRWILLMRLVISSFMSTSGFFLSLLTHSFFLTENTSSRVLLKQWALPLEGCFSFLRSCRLWDRLERRSFSSKELCLLGSLALRMSYSSSLLTRSMRSTRALLLRVPMTNAYCRSSRKWLKGAVALGRGCLDLRLADREVLIILSK